LANKRPRVVVIFPEYREFICSYAEHPPSRESVARWFRDEESAVLAYSFSSATEDELANVEHDDLSELFEEELCVLGFE
jgi:hypothetical protein